MNVYHRLPASANSFTPDDVLHYLAMELGIPVKDTLKRVIHVKRLRSKAIKQHGKLIARSSSNTLHSYQIVNGIKIQDASTFKSGSIVVTYEKSIQVTQKPGKAKPAPRFQWHVG